MRYDVGHAMSKINLQVEEGHELYGSDVTLRQSTGVIRSRQVLLFNFNVTKISIFPKFNGEPSLLEYTMMEEGVKVRRIGWRASVPKELIIDRGSDSELENRIEDIYSIDNSDIYKEWYLRDKL